MLVIIIPGEGLDYVAVQFYGRNWNIANKKKIPEWIEGTRWIDCVFNIYKVYLIWNYYILNILTDHIKMLVIITPGEGLVYAVV